MFTAISTFCDLHPWALYLIPVMLGSAGALAIYWLTQEWAQASVSARVSTHDWILTEPEERLKAASMPERYHRPANVVSFSEQPRRKLRAGQSRRPIS